MKAPIKTYGPQWHAARQSYIGASEVAAICGLNPYSTPEDVAESKYYPREQDSADTPNTPIWWGHRDEPAIVEAAKHLLRPTAQPWETRTGLSWLDQQHGLMASPDAVFLNGNRERKEITDGPTEAVEAKSVARAAAAWNSGPPVYVQLQGHTQMALLGPTCERLHIAARISGSPVQIWTIQRDEFVISAIKHIAKTWWDSYRSMGAAAWSAFAANTLADAGFSHAEPINRNQQTATGTADNVKTVELWRDARRQSRDWAARATELSIQLVEAMGEADTLVDESGNHLVRRSWVNRTGIDTKTLCAEHPDLETKYSYPMTHARLTAVKRLPEEEV